MLSLLLVLLSTWTVAQTSIDSSYYRKANKVFAEREILDKKVTKLENVIEVQSIVIDELKLNNYRKDTLLTNMQSVMNKQDSIHIIQYDILGLQTKKYKKQRNIATVVIGLLLLKFIII